MGSGGQVFGLCAYKGREGLDFYLRLIFDELDPEIYDIWAIQNALIAEFVNRQEMESEDLGVIKDLGLRFRGKNNYPQFRSHLPGYCPWFLKEDEAVYLTFALECACDFVARIENNPEVLEPPDGSHFFTYYPVEGDEGDRFECRWDTPKPFKKKKVIVPPTNELQLKRIKNKNLRKDSSWEIGTFYTPSSIADKDRPYWVRLCLIARQDGGFIVNMDPMDPEISEEEQIRATFLKAIEKSSSAPDTIATIDENLVGILEPIADQFKTQVAFVRDLPAVFEAKHEITRASMMDFPLK